MCGLDDVDECLQNVCDDICENSIGSFKCFCSREEFVLGPDERSCHGMR